METIVLSGRFNLVIILVVVLSLLQGISGCGVVEKTTQHADTNRSIDTSFEVTLFPFDSVTSFNNPCRFQGPSPRPGRDGFNSEESDQGRGSWSKERVYDISLTEPGATVAEHLVWDDHAAAPIDRWPYCGIPLVHSEHPVENCLRSDSAQVRRTATPIVIVITGHLFSEDNGGKGAGVDPNAVLLEIDILGAIAEGMRYHTGDSQRVTASHDTLLVYTTLQVHKSDLDPSHGGALYNYDRYRSVAIPVDLAGLKNVGIGGSSSQANTATRFGIRVRWIGAEKVALRSIVLRDGVVQ